MVGSSGYRQAVMLDPPHVARTQRPKNCGKRDISRTCGWLQYRTGLTSSALCGRVENLVKQTPTRVLHQVPRFKPGTRKTCGVTDLTNTKPCVYNKNQTNTLYASVAQLAEHPSCKRKVTGSIPVRGSNTSTREGVDSLSCGCSTPRHNGIWWGARYAVMTQNHQKVPSPVRDGRE